MEPIYFTEPAELRAWLEEHHTSATELLVGIWKKGTGQPTVAWPQIVDEALCFGWIDGITRRVDADRYAIRLTPRRTGSNWSAINIAKVAALRAAGRMRPAGEAAFAARREDRTGVYSFEQPETAALSAGEEATFRARPDAWAWFSARPPGYRRGAAWWVISARREETRARRLTTLIDDSAAGRPIKPLRPVGRSAATPPGPGRD